MDGWMDCCCCLITLAFECFESVVAKVMMDGWIVAHLLEPIQIVYPFLANDCHVMMKACKRLQNFEQQLPYSWMKRFDNNPLKLLHKFTLLV